eukprot:scaffold33626_cov67-Phaeocystis_antarctica.AAC.5
MVAARMVVRAAEMRAAGARAAEVMAVCPARHADHQLLREDSPEPKVESICSSCGRKPSQNELSGTRIATRSCSLRPGKSRMIWSRASTIFSEYSWKRVASSAPGGRSKRKDLSGGPSDSW